MGVGGWYLWKSSEIIDDPCRAFHFDITDERQRYQENYKNQRYSPRIASDKRKSM